MAADHSKVVNVAGSAPISISAYTQVFASVAFQVGTLVLANSTNTNITIAVGAAGSEVDFACVAAGSTLKLLLSNNQIPAGSRLACIAEGAASSTGEFTTSVIF